MKRSILFITLLLFACLTYAQESIDNQDPDEQIKVNKEYDENGNLIRYDSTYVRSWSSDSTLNSEYMESIQQHMNSYFGSDFFNDSTFQNADPFSELREFLEGQDFEYPEPGMNGFNDSTFVTPANPDDVFSYFDELRKQMGNSYENFLKADSLQEAFPDINGNMPFDSPEEIEQFFRDNGIEFESSPH